MVRPLLSHAEIRDELSGFALGLLEPAVADQIARHIGQCESCRRELDQFIALVDTLPLISPEARPPAELRQRVIRRFRDLDESDQDDAAAQAESSPRRFHRGVQFSLAAAAILLLALLGCVWVLYQDLSQTRDRLDEMSTQLSQEQRLLANAPRSIELIEDEEDGHENYGRLYVSSQSDEALLVVENLPPTPDGRVYQIWLVRGDNRDNAGTFETDETGNGKMFIRSEVPLSEYQALGITEEPGPSGSPGPTGPRIVGCPLATAAEPDV